MVSVLFLYVHKQDIYLSLVNHSKCQTTQITQILLGFCIQTESFENIQMYVQLEIMIEHILKATCNTILNICKK